MKHLLTCLVLATLLIGTTALATDLSKAGRGITRTPVPTSSNILSESDVLIACAHNGNFADLSPYYETAFLTAGATSVSIVGDGPNAPFTFPSPFTANEYGVIAILTTENWWGASSTPTTPEANVSLADEAAIGAYMDTGGAMLFAGQDYLWGRGGVTGFPQIYLGIGAATQDINEYDTDITYVGSAGGPLEGLTGTLHAEELAPIGPCFQDNPFFTDDITPYGGELFDYASSPSGVTGQAGATWDTGLYKAIFTSADLVCTDNTAQFQRDLTALYLWLTGGVTAVEETTWGSVKEMYK